MAARSKPVKAWIYGTNPNPKDWGELATIIRKLSKPVVKKMVDKGKKNG